VRSAAVVGGDLRDRAGSREQRVDLRDGGRLVAGLTEGHDRIQPGSVVQRRAEVARPAHGSGERVPVGQPLQVRDVSKLVRRTGPAGVDELDASRQGLKLISIKVTLTAVSGIP
jgi:hypothetical protein